MIGPFAVLNLASSVLMITFGLFVLRAGNGQALHRAFALFAAGFGAGTGLANLIEFNPLGLDATLVIILDTLRGLGYGAGGIGAIWLGISACARRPGGPSRLVLPTVLLILLGTAITVLLWRNVETALGSFIGGLILLGFILLVGGQFAMAALFGLEAGRVAADPEAFDLTAMAAALTLYPTLYMGFWLHGLVALRATDWSLRFWFAFILFTLCLAALTAVWLLAAGRRHNGRAARNMAILVPAIVLLAMILETIPCGALRGNCGGSFIVRILAVAILAYAIVRHQLFDIDLKIKWTLNRGTIAAVFVAAFFVVSELVAAVLSEWMGLVSGVITTGLLVFVLSPLQRFADRVADTAMPHVRDDEEYRTVRRRAVYGAAVRSALEGGTIAERQRAMLATLAAELGLDPRQAFEVERSVTQTVTPSASQA